MPLKTLPPNLNPHALQNSPSQIPIFFPLISANIKSQHQAMRGAKLEWFNRIPDPQYRVRVQWDHIRDRIHESVSRRSFLLLGWGFEGDAGLLGSCVNRGMLLRGGRKECVGEKEAKGDRKKGDGNGTRTGTLMKESAMNKWFSQCRTILPSKCPPVWIAVTPGTISSVLDLISRRMWCGSALLIQVASAAWV